MEETKCPTGHQAVIAQLLADGLDVMFGNPGTSEQGLLDALADYPAMRYILTLQESVAVMCADGYARARRRPGLVQLHSSPGIGNAVGALYQAMRGHAPLVVIGGDAGIRYQPMEAQMYADLVAMMAPVTKWSAMAPDPASLLRMLRRAIKVASTPPMGPVYLCLPSDVLDAPATEPVRPTAVPQTRVVPAPDLLAQAAAWLAGAGAPMLYVGDGVAYADASGEVEHVAELLGAEVWDVDSGEVNMAYTHACYQGATGHMFGHASLPILRKGDANLVVGTYIVPEVFPHLGDVWASGARTIHIDLDAYAIGKNHPVDLGLVADPKETLAALAAALERTMSPSQRSAAAARRAALEARHVKQHAPDVATGGVTVSAFAKALAARLPESAVIFDEALTSSPELMRWYRPVRTGDYHLTRGGSLGVGFPGAIGAKLANPDRPVIGFSGDGGSMYTIQALWTAAHHGIGAKFVVCNNGGYHLLDLNIAEYWRERGIAPHAAPAPFRLGDPALGFAAIAEGMGVPAMRVTAPAQFAEAIDHLVADAGPFLVDLVIHQDAHI